MAAAITFDWAGVLSGPPLQWLLTGVATTVVVSVVGGLGASLLAVPIVGLRISRFWPAQAGASAVVSVFRNSPLLVQLFFWYFAAYSLLPQGFRDWVNDDHVWGTLPGGVIIASPEFLCAAWGLAIFGAVFLAEELRAGLAAVPRGQREAAEAQGLSATQVLVHVLLPQAFANAWQPIVGQYLNIMKLSSLATAIGLAEITYEVRQIESYNAHAFEAFAIGTLLYLVLGLIIGFVLTRLGPSQAEAVHRRPTPQDAADEAIDPETALVAREAGNG